MLCKISLQSAGGRRRSPLKIIMKMQQRTLLLQFIILSNTIQLVVGSHMKSQWTYIQICESVTAILAAVKEQILTWYRGVRWELAHHAWSEGGRNFTSEELNEHLVQLVIHITGDLSVTPKPPVNIPILPGMKTLGTVSDLAEELETHTEDKLTEFKNKANVEMEYFEEI